MELAKIIIPKIMALFLMIAVGYLVAVFGILDRKTTRKMTDLLLGVVNPLLVFQCFQIQSTPEIAKNIPIALGTSVLAFGAQFAVAIALVHGTERPQVCFERLCVVFPSCGFLGIPIVSTLYGSEGVIYLSICIAFMNFLIWTAGILMISGRCCWKTMLKNVLSPTLIGVFLGLLFFLLKISLPDVLRVPVDSIAGMNTPLSMLISGALLYQADLKRCMRSGRVWLISAYGLLLCPLVVLLVLHWVPCAPAICMTQVLAAACPVAATIPMLSVRYNMAVEHTACIFAMTTLLCVVTIPVVVLLCGALL